MEKNETNQSINLNDLTPEQLKQLQNQLEEKQKADANRIYKERQQYKQLVDATVNELFAPLQTASDTLAEVKELVFSSFKTLIKMKAELYGKDTDQNTHTFTNEDGSIRITIGNNMTEKYDDTVDTGIAKVNDYLQTLVHDEQSKNLIEVITKLLSKNNKGVLKASKVLELKNLADKSGNKDFIEAIEIIQQAYKPVRSKEFVRCEFKGESTQAFAILPLSISEANFPAKEQPNDEEHEEQAPAPAA